MTTTMTKTILRPGHLLALTALCLLVAMPVRDARAADVAAGQAKADAVCAACHGKDGNTPIDPSYPRLAGQYGDYLQRALLDYKRKLGMELGVA